MNGLMFGVGRKFEANKEARKPEQRLKFFGTVIPESVLF